MVTRTTPPVCHTDVSLAGSFAAECEGAGERLGEDDVRGRHRDR